MGADKNTIATPSELYNEMSDGLELVKTLCGGTAAMRAAGNTFLPSEPGESPGGYNVRLQRSFLFPGFEHSVDGLTGQVFRKPIILGDDVPESISLWAENVDLSGRNLDVFSRAVFHSALRDGLTHIHADYPQALKSEGTTLADERATGARPYLRHIEASDVIWWWTEKVNGVEKLVEVRIKERVRVRDGDGEEYRDRIRVLTLGAFAVYEKGKSDVWVKIEEGTVSIKDEIPWRTVYTGRDGFMVAKPPMLELANLNVAHWQSSSDQRNILRVARVPFLFGAGIKEGEIGNVLNLSVSRGLIAADPTATLGWVEHTGSCIQSGENDLRALEEKMAVLGLELLVPRPGNELATGRVIDKAESDATLVAMAKDLQDSIEDCFRLMAKWGGLGPDGGSVTVNTDFGLTSGDQTKLTALSTARAASDLSRQTYWKQLKKFGVLSEDFDAEAEEVLLENEGNPPALSEEEIAAIEAGNKVADEEAAAAASAEAARVAEEARRAKGNGGATA